MLVLNAKNISNDKHVAPTYEDSSENMVVISLTNENFTFLNTLNFLLSIDNMETDEEGKPVLKNGVQT